MSSELTLLFACSIRPERNNNRVLKLIERRLKERGHRVRIIDPLSFNLPLLTTPYHYHSDPENQAPENLKELVRLAHEATQFIFTAGEHNWNVLPALKNMIDYLPHAALAFKPAGIVAYSTRHDHGVNAVAQLRMALSELGCLTVPHFSVLSNVDKSLSDDGEPTGLPSRCDALLADVDLVIEQVELVGQAMNAHRQSSGAELPKVHSYL